ncbi:MAG: hypothetical protein Q4G04_05140 [bacterium]|nr:hypothetical protein [bacterium]
MGLFDKIKNLFTDEEMVEEEIKVEATPPVYKPPKLPTVMRKNIEQQETTKMLKEEYDDVSDHDLRQTKEFSKEFKFPIAFGEEEVDKPIKAPQSPSKNILSRQAIKKKEAVVTPSSRVKDPMEHTLQKPLKDIVLEPYRGSARRNEKPKKFRCTPIISPVYGVLDKNYKKDEVMEKDESDYEIPRLAKNLDFETVRNKAYGTIEDELQKNLLNESTSMAKTTTAVKNKEEILTDLIDEDINDEENYCDFGVRYNETPEKPTKIDVDIDIDIDVNNKTKIKNDNTRELNFKITNHNEKEPECEKIETKEPAKEDDFDLTDDRQHFRT